MSADVSILLLVVAAALGVVSLIILFTSLRPRPSAPPVSLWPPTFFHPLASDAMLLQPRSSNANTLKTITAHRDTLKAATPQPDADRYRTAEVRAPGEPTEDSAEATNKVILPKEDDATNRHPTNKGG
jgi:hypothetical protein